MARETRKPVTADDDIQLALRTLRSVMASDEATPSARSAASRTMMEYYGYLGTGRTLVPDLAAKSSAEMTLDELQRRASQLRNANGADDSDLFAPE